MIKDLFTRLTRTVVDELFPIQCLGCGKQGESICESCVAELSRLTPPFCVVCSRPSVDQRCDWCRSMPIAVDGIRAPYLYDKDSLIQKALNDFKFHSMRAMAPELARHLGDYLASNSIPGDVIVPVPSHPSRLRSRGFNQAALLGRELSKLIDMPIDEKLLVKVKNTPSQLRMSNLGERWRNVEGSFGCNGNVGGKAVLLVDDIATTGGTMSACAGALKDAGASVVWGLAVARAP